jgi:hypothetical protein
VRSHHLFPYYGKDIYLESIGTVDLFFENLYNSLESISKNTFHLVEMDGHHKNLFYRIKYSSDALNAFLKKHSTSTNKICHARMRALQLQELFVVIEWTNQELSEKFENQNSS